MSANDTNTVQIKLQKEISALSNSISTLLEGVRKLRNPLIETHDKVPQATNQLDKISEQTEAAAHQMLDVVEKITVREEEVIASLKQCKELAESGNTAAIIVEVDEIIQKADKNLSDAYLIMDALQFQDITSQQMDHAASLLEEVEGKLHRILSDLGSQGDEPEETSVKPAKTRAFDPHADLFEKKTDQAEIDNMFDHPDSSQKVGGEVNVK